MNEKMFKLAMSYLSRGWSVIPCGKDKRPLINWKEFQNRKASPTEILSWFEKFPEAQIGIVTGKISNLCVVDIEKGGDTSFLPQNTMIVKTGGRGFHYLFLFEEGITNKARIRELTDIRSEGGYIVAAGSVSEKGPYEIIKDVPLLPFPKELFPEKNPFFQNKEPQGTLPSNISFSSVLDYPGYSQGQRNDQMVRFIGKVLTKVHPSDWETEAWAIIESANTRNTPPLGQNELRTTFESIKGAEKRNSPLRWLKGDFNAEYGSPQTDSLEQPNVLEDDEVKHIADVAESQKINISEVYPLDMTIFDEAILGGVIGGDLIVVSGQTSHGKSSLCQDWTMRLARGSKKIKSLWFSYELMVSEIWRKFQEMGATKEDMIFAPAKNTTGNLDWVEKKIKEAKEKFGIKAVVIDHLGFLLPKVKRGMPEKSMSSNYATYLTQIVREIKTIALQEEIIIFLPVHMKKKENRNSGADIEDLKDSSGIGQEADLVFLIEREKNKEKNATTVFSDYTKIILAKNRRTGKTKIGRFSMQNGRFVHQDIDNELETFTKELNNEAKKEKVIPIPFYNKIETEKEEEWIGESIKKW